MTRDALASVLARLPSYERAQVSAIFGRDWSPMGVADAILAVHGPAYLVVEDGEPAAAGGLHPAGGGVWDAWVVVARNGRRRAAHEHMTCAVRNGLHWAMQQGVTRIDAYHLANQPRVHRWLETLGLKHAQDLPAYGVNGEDFVRYEATQPWA